jgi:hypothetical protein
MSAPNYDYLLSKVGDSLPLSTRQKIIEIIGAAHKAGHKVRFVWGMGSSAEHSTGRAVDFMVSDNASGDFIRNYIWANRARLKLRHVIWEQRITSTVTSPGVIRQMEDRGNATKNHFDHVHVLFNDAKAYVPGTRPPAPKPPAPRRKTIQQLAKEVIAGRWGDGDTRIKRLKRAGYNPKNVQAEVNRILR